MKPCNRRPADLAAECAIRPARLDGPVRGEDEEVVVVGDLTAPGSAQADSAGGPIPRVPPAASYVATAGDLGLIAEHACAECFGPLEVDYDPALMKAVTREQIEAGPQNIWRYAGLLPVGQDPASRVSLDPGLTLLVRADWLAEELGLTGGLLGEGRLGPTPRTPSRTAWSASPPPPPRASAIRRSRPPRPATPANSAAAHAARAGIPSFVFIPSDLEAGQGGAVRRLRPDAGRRRFLRRRQPADQRARRDRRVRGHRVRQPERPALLRRGLQDDGLRDRRAARLADPGPGRHPDGVGLAAHHRSTRRSASSPRPGSSRPPSGRSSVPSRPAAT